MSRTTFVRTIPLVAPEWFGDCASDFDITAIHREYVDAVERDAQAIVPSVRITYGDVSGSHDPMVYCDVEDIAAACEIGWLALLTSVDVSEIAARHDISGRQS
jgi:hypothetical protein